MSLKVSRSEVYSLHSTVPTPYTHTHTHSSTSLKASRSEVYSVHSPVPTGYRYICLEIILLFWLYRKQIEFN